MMALRELERNLDDALDLTILSIPPGTPPPIVSSSLGAQLAFTKLVGASTPPAPAEFDPASPAFKGQSQRYAHDAAGKTLKLHQPFGVATPLVVANNIKEIQYSFDAADPGEPVVVAGFSGRRNNYVNVKIHARIESFTQPGDVTVVGRIATHSRRAGP